MFTNRSFTGTAISAFTLSAGLYSLFFFLTLYFQNFLGFGALGTGLRLLPFSALVLFSAPLAGVLTGRIGARPVLFTGMALLAVAVSLMTLISPQDTLQIGSCSSLSMPETLGVEDGAGVLEVGGRRRLRPVGEGGGVVDEHVEPAELPRYPIGEFPDAIAVGDVEGPCPNI